MMPIKRNWVSLATLSASIGGALLAAFLIVLPGLRVDFPSIRMKTGSSSRVRVEYWDMWTGFEGTAIQNLVDRFNASQDRIQVDKITVSQINERFLVSVAGNKAPDIASIFTNNIPSFAEKGSLYPLDELARERGIGQEDYLPVFWKMCTYRGILYALPTTGATLALHYNKDLFREAGLDPERPPRTLEELDRMSEQMTRFDAQGRMLRIGFLPTQPGWWHSMWSIWFGGNLWDGHERLTIDSEEYIRALEWAQGYARKYGSNTLQNFRSGFGNFNSPQDPFLSGQIAMTLQGVWMFNFIDKYNPELDCGVAPFPSAVPGLEAVSLVETNILCIPANAPHPKEAFEFIAFLQKQENLEQLCLDQRKLSPLRQASERYRAEHPHPYFEVFDRLARSPNAASYPKLPIWMQLSDELNAVFTEVWLLHKTPRQALGEVQTKMEKEWQRELSMIRQRQGVIEGNG